MKNLEFEKSVSALEQQIKELRETSKLSDINIASLISKLQSKVQNSLKQIYQKLTPWQIVQVARLAERPKFTEYLKNIFDNFIKLSGDRLFGEDSAIIAGFASIDDRKCILIGQEKGSDTDSRIKHNFGMARPEGYRKALRLFELANRFNLPIITFIDTAGAYPGIESEERGQAEAIARCIEKSFQVHVPIISVIIGEGGSGGAIALATADCVLMLEFSIYSVISPEGCASILWKDDKKAEIAAEVQCLTAHHLKHLGIIDSIIREPIGGAQRNKPEIFKSVKTAILQSLDKINSIPTDERITLRRQKFLKIGKQFVI